MGRPLPGLPPGRLGGLPVPRPAPRRGRRRVERHALLLAAVVPRAAPRDPAPRARRDVGDDPQAGLRRGRRRDRAPPRAAHLPHDARRHAVGLLARRDHRAARAPGAPRPRRRARRGPAVHARGSAQRRAARRRRRPPRARQALRRAVPARSPRRRASVPTLRGVVVGEGYERPRLEAVLRTSSERRAGSSCAAASRTARSSRCTARRGSSPPRRCARDGG